MSKEKIEREVLIKETTTDLMKDKFVQELGSKVRVERHKVNNEIMDQLRLVLKDIGENIREGTRAIEGCEHVGSLSVHVYWSHALNEARFVTLTSMGKMNFNLADGALRELTGTTHEMYGKSRKKTRAKF
jgi:hypothetical protein